MELKAKKRIEAMGYKVEIDKNQISFLPVCLDDFARKNHPCCVINAFTELLDMEKLGYKYRGCQKPDAHRLALE